MHTTDPIRNIITNAITTAGITEALAHRTAVELIDNISENPLDYTNTRNALAALDIYDQENLTAATQDVDEIIIDSILNLQLQP